ncbi:MAG: hypothetical protein NTW51_10170 [Cyanobacteria bacterium]|nr:hypothetical protein [Cyanobacteriota bacterium]
MSLVELMLASGLLLGSSAASLGVWNRVSTTLLEQRVELEQLQSLEVEVQALEARLRDPRQDPLGQHRSCEEQLQRLVARLENQPPRSGVVRTLEIPAGGEVLLIHLQAGDQERRRLYSPAAFGGCGGDPAGLPAQAPGQAEAPTQAESPAQALAEGGGNGAL